MASVALEVLRLLVGNEELEVFKVSLACAPRGTRQHPDANGWFNQLGAHGISEQ